LDDESAVRLTLPGVAPERRRRHVFLKEN
jgi:hypothetical protein